MSSTWGLLTRYAEEHGTVEGIQLHKQLDGYNLGQWITDQRQRFVRGVTTSDEKRRLEALPGWTWEFRTQSKWNEWYELLLAWADEHGDVDKLPLKTPFRGRRLGEWVFIQQKMYAGGRLPEDRVARLKAVRGWVWSKTGVRWDERFQLLEQFVAREGHARVPRDHVEEGEPLGEWVKIQRDAYRGIKGRRLTKARAAKLESLDGWTWDPQDARWEKGFERLGVYVEREKHARPPLGFMEGDFALGNWVSRQRYAQRRGRLQQERAARLEALPGWHWNPPKGGSKPGRRLGRVKKPAV